MERQSGAPINKRKFRNSQRMISDSILQSFGFVACTLRKFEGFLIDGAVEDENVSTISDKILSKFWKLCLKISPFYLHNVATP